MKFSVIIPCYHSEEFIATAIKSVKEQLFEDYELLVLCESGDTASIEAVKACGVEPIVDDFGSSGAARNAGIDRAQGEYILFLDSDDWFMGPDCFSILDQFTRIRLDILTCGFIFGVHGYAGPLANRGNMYPNVWSRVWRRQYLIKNKVRFPDSSRDEDVLFVQQAFAYDPEHRVTDLPFVHYTYPREGSRMNEKERESNG